MGDRETLDAYTEDINSKCRRLNLPDPDRMQIFIQGLTNDLKEYVLLQQPVTLLDAQEAARLKQAAFQTTSKSRALEDLITDSVKKIQLSNSVATLQQPSTEISDLKREIKTLKDQLRNISIHRNNSAPRNGDFSFHNNGKGALRYLGPLIWNIIPSEIKKRNKKRIFLKQVQKTDKTMEASRMSMQAMQKLHS